MRSGLLGVALVACGAASAQPSDSLFRGAAELDRQALVVAVLERNPNLDVARAAIAAAQAVAPLVALRPDPGIALRLAPASLGAGMRVGYELEVTQELPFSRRLELMARVAETETLAGRAELARLRQQLVAEALRLHGEFFLIERELELSRQHLNLLEDLKQVATARYAAGLGRQSEPLLAEVELGHLHHRVIELESHRAVAQAGLNVLLDRDLEAPLPPPAAPPWSLAQHRDLSELTARALEDRPELVASDVEIRRLEHELELARLVRRPDLEVMASYSSMWDDREHRLMVGVGLSPPLSRARQDARVVELEARLEAARAGRKSLERQVRFEVFEATARFRQAIHHIELYDSRLLPAAEDETRATLASYRSGKGEIMEVVESERRLREVELGRFQAITELAASRADLDRAAGQDETP